MINKLILILSLLSISLLANESKYLNKENYGNYDYRIFMGLEASYTYVRSDLSLDPSMYSYGLYMGLPIFFGNELIVKRKEKFTNNNKIKENSLILNIPFMARSSRQSYFGLVYGEGEVIWDNNDIIRLGLNEKKVKDSFYGIHLGKRFKYTRNYHVRIEVEFMKYNYETKSSIENVDGIYSLGFNYGFEYRF